MKVHLITLPKMPGRDEELAEHRPVGRNVERYQTMLSELEQIALYADEIGITAYGTTEHHFHTEGREAMPSPLMFYVKLAQQTENLVFMPTSLVMSARDPLRTAEDVALFDCMFPGRLKFSVARGYQKRWVQTLMQRDDAVSSFKPEEQEMDALNREIFNEHCDVMMAAWTEESVQYEGKHYQVPFPASGIDDWPGWEFSRDFGAQGEVTDDGVLKRIGVIPPPATKPHPEMFVPFSGSEQTLLDTARRGWGVLSLQSKPDLFRAQCEQYLQIMRDGGHDLKLGDKMVAVRAMCIGDTYEEAMELAIRTVGWEFQTYFSKFGFSELFRVEEDDPNQFVSFPSAEACAQRMAETNHLICGTPDQVVEQLTDLERCYSDGHLDWLSWEFYQQGNCSVDVQKQQLKRFCEEVWPRVEANARSRATPA